MADSNAGDDSGWIDEIISEELPQHHDPVLQQYHKARNSLIAEEKKQRSDHAFRQSLSPIAKRACAIVSNIRQHEQRTVWTSSLEEKMATAPENQNMTFFPGMMFTMAKSTMESTLLWKIVRRMPKGALLHAHLDAMVDFDYLFNLLFEIEGLHLACTSGSVASKEGREEAVVAVKFRNPRPCPPSHLENVSQEEYYASIWNDDSGRIYKQGEFIPLNEAADRFPEGGRKGFVQWLKDRCTLSSTDGLEQHHGIEHIWNKFIKCFVVLNNILHYEPIWRAFLRRLMEQSVEDGVYWIEIRFAWGLDYHRSHSETPEPDYNHMFQVMAEEIAAFRTSNPHPLANKFWGIRMIWTAIRSWPTKDIIASMANCITTKLEFPELLSGFDLVGYEEHGRPLVDLLPELFWFRKQCAIEGVEIPFFFHAGECLGDGDSTDKNLFDAVLLGTRRIGHGFSLYKHPKLIQAVKDKKILIESCPISNEMLRLTGSIMQHPLPALLARGVACALCNDDPAILGQDTAGMTHDFWQALQGWENLGLAGLGELAENSVRWAAFEDQGHEEWVKGVREASVGTGVKAERLKEWRIEWEKFCLWVVEEFGDGEFGKIEDGEM
ncbi:adenosine deaminase [Rhypophila sp. PSN 637]